MSGFLNQSVPQLVISGGMGASDDRSSRADYQWFFGPPARQVQPWMDGLLWPNSRGTGGQFSSFGMFGDDAGIYGGHWEPYLQWGWDADGGAVQNSIIGQTLDANGNPLGNCNVAGYVTATNAFVGSVTSDTNGYLKLPTPYTTNTQHYLVCTKPSTSVGGTSVTTLTPNNVG